jgi:hypothetical protein
MKFYFLNYVQLSCNFSKVVPSGTTQGYFCPSTQAWCKNFIFEGYYVNKLQTSFGASTDYQSHVNQDLASIVLLQHWLSKYFKLMKICVVMVLGSVKDKWYFSTLSFMSLTLKVVNKSFWFGDCDVCLELLFHGNLSK